MNKLLSVAALATLATSALATDGKVVNLTPDNFDSVIASQENGVLVKFFAPWCGHCKTLAPEYEKAAEMLKDKAVIAEVDCTEHRDLCSTYGIKGFPTLKLITKDGAVTEFDDARKADPIAKWVIKQSQPAFVVVNSEDELKKFKADGDDIKVVINTAADSVQAEVLKKTAAALRKDVSFAIFTGKTDNAITLYRSFDEPEVVYSGDVNADAVQAWVKSESLPLLGEIGPQNFMKYVDRNLPLVWVFVDYTADAQKDVLAALTPVAKQYRDKVVFAKLDGNRWGEHAKTFGLSGTTPGVVIEDRATRKNYVFPEDKAVTTEAFSAHVESFLKGDLAATIRSQDIPADNDGPVKVLVAKQYDELVMDNSKDAFVEFYAPWCGHCKSLAPKWEELGKLFASEPNLVIAKGDATENDYPVEIQGFPTILFFPAGDKKNPVTYSGERSVEAMAKFVREHATALKTHDEL